MLQIVLPRILKAFRSVRSLTQEEAAELAAVSPLTWHRWEVGKTSPNPCQLTDLAKALGQTPLEFSAAIAEALHRHFAGELAAREGDESVAAAASRALLDAVCAELRRATTNLEILVRQVNAGGDAALVTKLCASTGEARSALDRVHGMLIAAATAADGREGPDGE